jgi:uncharacterized protein YbaP (TraB family)
MKRVVLYVALVAALGPACKSSPEPATPAGSGTASAGARPAASPPVTGSGSATAALDPPAPIPAPGSASADVKPAVAVLAHPLLWSAEKDGKTTYLFGTMHMGIDAETRLPPLVWTKLHDAKAFAMEADINDPKLITAMIAPAKTTLKAELGDAYWKKLEDAIGPAIANAVDRMQPMIAGAMLAIRGLPPTEPMDKALSARAAGEHKPIVYLEPAMFQLEMLKKWMDIKALKLLLDDAGKTEARSHQMLDAYVAGDDKAILAINDGEKADALAHGIPRAEYDQQMAEMLYNRNASWIAPIDKLHADGGGFVAVGLLHLIGPRSVPALLAAKGYKVTRVVP